VIAGDVVQRFANLRKMRRGWSARCSAHDDRENSLSLAIGDDGRLLIYCFAGCRPEAVLRAIGLDWHDVFPERRPGAGPARLLRRRSVTEIALEIARRQAWARSGVGDLYEDADSIRVCHRVVARARRVATGVGPREDVWDLLATAAGLETLTVAAP